MKYLILIYSNPLSRQAWEGLRQIVRQTKNLGLAQRQAGWSRLQTVYLTVGDAEAREIRQQVTD